MAPSDSPLLCMPDVRLSPSPAGLRLSLTVGDGVSRFSCIQFRGVPGVSDYVGPLSGSRSYAVTACCLPLQTTGSATSVCGFRSSTPCPSLPLSMLRTAPRDARRKTRGQDGFAAPFLSDSFIPYCMPVYPGARSAPPVFSKKYRDSKKSAESQLQPRLTAHPKWNTYFSLPMPNNEHIPILDDVLFTLQPQKPLFADSWIATQIDQRLPVHYFGPDELFLEIGVDRPPGLHRIAADRDGPGVDFGFSGSQKRHQPKQPITGRNQPLQARLFQSIADQILPRLSGR